MKKGFTLIELLAVIIVLAIILMIASSYVINTVEKTKIKAYQTNEDMLIRATMTYLTQNTTILPDLNSSVEISLATLKANGQIKNIKDPFDSSDCTGYIIVKNTDGKYTYIPNLRCDTISNNSIEDEFVAYFELADNTNQLQAKPNAILYNTTITLDRLNNNGALDFNGTTSYVDLNYGINYNPFTKPLSIMLWVKSDSPTLQKMFLTSGQVPTSNNRLYLGTNASKWDLGINTSGWGSGTVNATTEWTHVALVMSGGNAKYYINGKLENTRTYASYILNKNIYLGNHDGSYYFDGKIDKVKIYERALSDNEIKIEANS